MAAYRISLIWFLRVIAAVTLMLIASYVPSLIAGSDSVGEGAIRLSETINTLVLGCVAFSVGEILARAESNELVFGRALGWFMRIAALVVFVLYLPTLFGVLRTLAISQMEPRDMFGFLALTITSLVAAPLLMLGCAETLLHAARHDPLDGQKR